MAATKNMSDAELRNELKKLGFSPGPITDSTRGVLMKKLQNLKSGSAKSQKASREKARKSEGSTRSRRSEPLEDERGDWEDEEEIRTNLSARPSHRPETNSYGGSGRAERKDDGFYTDGKSVTSHVGDTGLWRSDRSSSPAGSDLTRGTAGYSDSLRYNHGSSLGGERLKRINPDYSDYLGKESRLYLEGERYTRTSTDYGSLGQEARSSLGGERYTRTMPNYGSLEQEARPTVGGEIYKRTTPNYSDYLGLEGELFPKTTSDYGSFGQGGRSFLGGERFTKNAADYSSSLGQEPRSTGERSSWSSFPVNRDEGRHWSRYNEGYAKDHLSYKNYPILSGGKHAQSKQNWSKMLEYYLSKLLRALSVGLFIIFFGILITNSEIFYRKQHNDIKLIPPDCEGKDDKYCQAMQKQVILQMLSELYNFLSLEAGSFECGNPSGLSSKCIPIRRAKEHVMNVFDHAPEKFDSALDWLLDRDEHLGIWAKDEDGEISTTRSRVFCVESSRPQLGLPCRLTNALYTAISNLFLALFGVFVLWLFLIYLRYHWKKLEEEENQMFAMVEKIIDVVKHHYNDYQQGIEQNPYIGILHVRDTLIMPQDRKRLKRVWDRAVQFVEDNESRLRTESQRLAGADLRVWRWTQTRHEIHSERRFSSSFLSAWGK